MMGREGYIHLLSMAEYLAGGEPEFGKWKAAPNSLGSGLSSCRPSFIHKYSWASASHSSSEESPGAHSQGFLGPWTFVYLKVLKEILSRLFRKILSNTCKVQMRTNC